MKSIIISIVMLVCILKATAQTDSIKSNVDNGLTPIQNTQNFKKIGINLNVKFLMFYGITIDYFIFQNLSLDLNVGIGTFFGRYTYPVSFFYSDKNHYQYSASLHYWFKAKNKHKGFFPTIGLSYGSFGLRMGDEVDHFRYIAIPTGIAYLNKSGFQTSLLINNTLMHQAYPKFQYLPLPELKIGWRF